MNSTASIDDELAWLALLASGVEGSADISHDRFADEVRRLRTPARSLPQPEAVSLDCSQE